MTASWYGCYTNHPDHNLARMHSISFPAHATAFPFWENQGTGGKVTHIWVLHGYGVMTWLGHTCRFRGMRSFKATIGLELWNRLLTCYNVQTLYHFLLRYLFHCNFSTYFLLPLELGAKNILDTAILHRRIIWWKLSFSLSQLWGHVLAFCSSSAPKLSPLFAQRLQITPHAAND